MIKKEFKYFVFYRDKLQAIMYTHANCQEHMRGEIRIMGRNIKDYLIVSGERLNIFQEQVISISKEND